MVCSLALARACGVGNASVHTQSVAAGIANFGIPIASVYAQGEIAIPHICSSVHRLDGLLRMRAIAIKLEPAKGKDAMIR